MNYKLLWEYFYTQIKLIFIDFFLIRNKKGTKIFSSQFSFSEFRKQIIQNLKMIPTLHKSLELTPNPKSNTEFVSLTSDGSGVVVVV